MAEWIGSRRRTTAVIALAAMAVVGAACGDDTGSAQTSTSASTSASSTATGGSTTPTSSAGQDVCTKDRVGGEVTMAAGLQTLGLDPTVTYGTGQSGGTQVAAIYDTLMRWNPDSGLFEPFVAQSLTPNVDFTVWTLKLRPGIKFGNGDPLNAVAVKKSIDRFVAKPTISATDLQLVTDDKVIDDLTLQLTLKRAWATFPYTLADEGGMVVNTNVLDKLGADAFNLSPVGAGVGPYEVVSNSTTDGLVLKAKTDYWGGPVCIQKLTFKTVPQAAVVDAFKTGELQVALSAYASDNKLLRDLGGPVSSDLSNLGSALRINVGFGDHPTKDPRVRQAVQMAIDTKAVDQRVNAGDGYPTSGIVHPSSPLYPKVDGLAFDPTKAKALVAAAKADGWNGKISLLAPADPSAVETSITIGAMLKDVGMDVTVDNSLQIGDLLTRVIQDHNFDLAVIGWTLAPASPGVFLQRYLGTGNTFSGYSRPEFDGLLNEMYLAATPDAERAVLAKMQVVWNKDVPLIVFGANERLTAWSPKVHGLYFNEDIVVHFDKAYIDK